MRINTQPAANKHDRGLSHIQILLLQKVAHTASYVTLKYQLTNFSNP